MIGKLSEDGMTIEILPDEDCSSQKSGNKKKRVQPADDCELFTTEEAAAYTQLPEFDGKNIPIKDAARLMGKDQQFVRQGIIRGILPIGTAFKRTLRDPKWGVERESKEYDFYISPRKFWEYTGVVYRSDSNNN